MDDYQAPRGRSPGVESPYDSSEPPFDPRPRRQPPHRALYQSARLAALLGVALVALVVVALVLPGLPAGSNPPSRAPLGSPVAGTSPSAAPSFVRPTPTPQPTFLTWVVRSGDSLNSIARRFETTARSIAFWNRDTYPSLDPESEGYAPDRIQIGWPLLVLPGVVYDEAASPTSEPASPTPPPATAAPGTPAASAPPHTGRATVISHGPRGTNRIALTFDMGGRLDPAVDIVTWLIDHEVRATIFPTGKQATEHPQGRAAMELVRDHPELFELANHSWDHPAFTELSAAEMRDQLDRSESALSALIGRTSRPWFRPPYGAWNAEVRAGVGAAGWSTIVMWDIDTIDWRPTSDGGPTARDIEAKVLANAQGGSIVLMHLGGWNTLEALPGLLDGLREQGLLPVTLSELVGG